MSEIAQYLTFAVAGEHYAIDVSQVREVLDQISITKVPRTPAFMLGVINLRGNVVPIIELRQKFGMDRAERTRDTCIIVLEVETAAGQLVVGAQVDAVSEVIEMDQSQIEPPPSIGTKLDIEFIRGMGKVNGQFVMVLDIQKIFTSEELALLSEAEKLEAVQ